MAKRHKLTPFQHCSEELCSCPAVGPEKVWQVAEGGKSAGSSPITTTNLFSSASNEPTMPSSSLPEGRILCTGARIPLCPVQITYTLGSLSKE